MNNEISKLSGDEIDKFNSVIELYGFSIDDFGIAEIRESTDNEDIKIVKSIKGKIKIIRMSLLGTLQTVNEYKIAGIDRLL